jgi:hypothetical protein
VSITKQNLVWSFILLAGLVLGCRQVGKEVARDAGRETERKVEREAEPAIARALKPALDEATKKTVITSMRTAARDGDGAARIEFERLSREEPAFRKYLKEFGNKAKDSLRECIIKEVVYDSVPDSVKDTKIIKLCFGEPSTQP